VSLDDWILALHVLSAFALAAGITLFWVIIVAGRQSDTPEATLRLGPTSRVAGAAVGVGGGGTLLFGVWLALSYGDYDLWDGWIIAALVLWVIMAALGQRTDAEYSAGVKKAQELQRAGQSGPSAELLALNRTSRGLALQFATTVVILLLLIDMIWKPGA
jgi:hypothetical protein